MRIYNRVEEILLDFEVFILRVLSLISNRIVDRSPFPWKNLIYLRCIALKFQ